MSELNYFGKCKPLFEHSTSYTVELMFGRKKVKNIIKSKYL